MPGVTLKQAEQRQPYTSENTILFYGREGIGRTARVEATGRAEQGGESPLVAENATSQDTHSQ